MVSHEGVFTFIILNVVGMFTHSPWLQVSVSNSPNLHSWATLNHKDSLDIYGSQHY